uniref:uncharacterized protein LOC117265621 n=1 Tax=Epinephelus lanceolatus TaxID=310571 RepID=UPI001445C37D|nr:uncharacterized protein LOC117265621 [Epinephelus lanceolatus]
METLLALWIALSIAASVSSHEFHDPTTTSPSFNSSDDIFGNTTDLTSTSPAPATATPSDPDLIMFNTTCNHTEEAYVDMHDMDDMDDMDDMHDMHNMHDMDDMDDMHDMHEEHDMHDMHEMHDMHDENASENSASETISIQNITTIHYSVIRTFPNGTEHITNRTTVIWLTPDAINNETVFLGNNAPIHSSSSLSSAMKNTYNTANHETVSSNNNVHVDSSSLSSTSNTEYIANH